MRKGIYGTIFERAEWDFKFKRQVTIGKYIVDFVCHEKKLIIELDGGQHMSNNIYDEKRSDWLMAHGFSVLRFWNHEVFQQTTAILDVILKNLLSNESSSKLLMLKNTNVSNMSINM